MFSQPAAAAINHLLSQNSWALPRLAKFADKTVQFDIAPFSVAYTILADGTLRAADAGSNPDASCVLAPSLLPRLALKDENAYAEVRSAGDAELLKEVFYLSRNLDWDAAEDLSHVTGDIAAERIVQTLHSVHQHISDVVVNLSHAAAEYWTEERPLLAKPRHVATFIQQVDQLRDDAARLELRINRLLSGKPF
jgi:ubiquinone biosynthesis protein UbiJ